MRILTDMHHAGLLQSLILLFEKRLGGELYRPIGRDWYDKGFWAVYPHPATVEQFLGIGGNTPDGTAKLNEVVDHPEPDIYKCHDIDSGTDNKAITFNGFLSRHFDIVIASLPQHIEPYFKLCQLHPDKPKLIYQVGNAWNYGGNISVKNIMASTSMGGISVGLNTIEYHQEFDTKIFCPTTGTPGKNIYSFVNCFNIADIFASDYQLFLDVERNMPEWSLKVYGGQCRDGAIGPTPKLADKMREAMFIWHTKFGGDGYGHVIHNVPAIGRPLIVKKQYYIGKMAEPLLIDGVTCIAIDGMSYQQIINKIMYYSEQQRYTKMCQDTYHNFIHVVDFDKEQKNIEKFLSNLL
jgi:hypothetical protein